VLTAVNGTLNDSDASVSGYQWTRDGVNIAGATASTYTVTEVEVVLGRRRCRSPSRRRAAHGSRRPRSPL